MLERKSYFLRIPALEESNSVSFQNSVGSLIEKKACSSNPKENSIIPKYFEDTPCQTRFYIELSNESREMV